MAVKIKDLAREVVAALDSAAGYELAGQWVYRRYQELVSRARFRHLRQYGQLFIPPPIDDGTVTITENSRTVTANAAATTAIQANAFFEYPQGFQGLFFRPQQGRTWYRISQVNGSTIELETPFASDNGALFAGATTANVTYYIVQRFARLDPEARTIGTMVADYMYRPLDVVSEDELSKKYPNRYLVSAYPWVVAELGNDLDFTGQPKLVEFYPSPIQSITVHYTFWAYPREMETLEMLDHVLPPVIDRDVLKEGALIDVMRYEMARAFRNGQVEAGAAWRNEYRAQETRWEAKIGRAVRNDRAMDDLKFMLRYGRWKRAPIDYDPVQDAVGNFLARGV